MCYSFGHFVDEQYKPTYYDACASFAYLIIGLFPHANPAELFVYTGIAAGIIEKGYATGNLAIRYFLVGVIIILIRRILTEKIYAKMIKNTEKSYTK